MDSFGWFDGLRLILSSTKKYIRVEPAWSRQFDTKASDLEGRKSYGVVDAGARVWGNKISATVDDMGNVNILNYPAEWQGKATLVRFDGQNIESPFSLSHCEEIRAVAASGVGNLLVRSGYHSKLIFERAPFMSYEFVEAIKGAAKKAGLNFPSYILKNSIDLLKNTAELSFNTAATSLIIGKIGELEQQLDLGRKGAFKGPLEQMVIVSSGDLMCDLISGNATLSITYPIQNEDRAIKISYEPLQVKLEQS